jgi:hypothetical protein
MFHITILYIFEAEYYNVSRVVHLQGFGDFYPRTLVRKPLLLVQKRFTAHGMANNFAVISKFLIISTGCST